MYGVQQICVSCNLRDWRFITYQKPNVIFSDVDLTLGDGKPNNKYLSLNQEVFAKCGFKTFTTVPDPFPATVTFVGTVGAQSTAEESVEYTVSDAIDTSLAAVDKSVSCSINAPYSDKVIDSKSVTVLGELCSTDLLISDYLRFKIFCQSSLTIITLPFRFGR